METDQDDLRTGTAIASRASHEHYLRFLVVLNDKLQRSHKQTLLTNLKSAATLAFEI